MSDDDKTQSIPGLRKFLDGKPFRDKEKYDIEEAFRNNSAATKQQNRIIGWFKDNTLKVASALLISAIMAYVNFK